MGISTDRFRVFLSHSPEDLGAYFGQALPRLSEMATVVYNPTAGELTTAELIDAAEGCQVIIAHRSTPGPASVFEARVETLAFLRTAVDISTIDVAAASAAGVAVGHAEKSFVPSTAELAVGLLLDVWRQITASSHDYRRRIEPTQRPGRQARGKVAGIIGYGAIGSYLADLLQGLGMRVVIHDTADVDLAPGVESVGFDELLRSSDAVFPLAPALPETADLIDAAALALMQPGSVLVNVSRGELVDEEAVFSALESGHLAGFGADVGRAPDQRPSPFLAERSDVVATPHLGGLTPENADAQAMSAVDQVAAILAGDMPPRIVNPGDATRLRAWLAE
ncbi:MAG: NAD(P)-dependent oxidoreductase [Acidimicrobiales bacterium]